MRTGILLLALFASALLFAGSAAAAPPVLLAVGQVDHHPTATWSLPAGVQTTLVEVATDPAPGPDGYFLFKNLATSAAPAGTDTSWTSPLALDPGTYYVNVVGYEPGCGTCPAREFSNVLTLVIPAPPPPPPGPPLPTSITATRVTSATGDGRGTIRVSWSLPAGAVAWSIEIARDSAVDSGGSYALDSLVAIDWLWPDQTSYTTRPQPPGTYYVHVRVYPANYRELARWSGTTTVVVPERTPVPAVTLPQTSYEGNSSAAIRSRTRVYVQAGTRLVRLVRACPSCSIRQLKAFARVQTAYARFVARDIAQPAPCKEGAAWLHLQLGESAAATSALLRSSARGQAGATLRAMARKSAVAAGRAIRSSRLYARCQPG